MVLIVEDEIVIAEVLKDILALHKINSYTCVNGRQALEWLEKNHPSLILSDVMMPIMNGMTFLEQVKASTKLQNIPFFFMSSGNLGQKDPRISGFVRKPFDIDQMVDIIKSAL